MTFLDFLTRNQDKVIYIDPCEGNNGDELIWLGMQETLSKIELQLTMEIEKAELIVINGGGAFIDAYKQGINKIEFYSKKYPNAILAVAPSSYHFKTIDFGFYLDLRTMPLYLFSREKYSKSFIDNLAKTRPLIHSEIDNDLAFNLNGSEFIEKLKNQYTIAETGQVLVVDRMDVENSNANITTSIIKKIYIRLTPEFIKTILRKYRVKHREAKGTLVTKKVIQHLNKSNPEYKTKKVITKDISRKDVSDFNQFCDEIGSSDYIYTNRLHVALLAHLLDKKVFLIEGSYHKLTGIYEYSMQEKQSTTLLRDF